MATQVSICNLALNSIGAPTIVNYEQNSASGRAVRASYDESRKAVLSMHPWSFALTRTTSSATVNTPAFNYTYEHNFPSDALYILPPGQGTQPYDDYKIEGRTILSNSDTLYLRYIKDEDTESVFSPLFANAFAAYLAWQIVMALVQGNTGRREKERLWGDFERLLMKARQMDSGQLAGVNATSFALEDARYDGVVQHRDLT